MTFTNNIILVLFFCITNTLTHRQVDNESNNFNEGDYKVKLFDDNSVYSILFKEVVRIQVYYQSLDFPCLNFMLLDLNPLVETMSSYLDIQIYPFGNTKIINDNGNLQFECPVGPSQCYVNKLNACALDKLQHPNALLYNICLMYKDEQLGSDDESADWCAKSMNIDSEPIKECAKGTRGTELLLYYGEESKKANFSYVPHVLINGKTVNTIDMKFKEHVCAAFNNPPPPCTDGYMQ